MKYLRGSGLLLGLAILHWIHCSNATTNVDKRDFELFRNSTASKLKAIEEAVYKTLWSIIEMKASSSYRGSDVYNLLSDLQKNSRQLKEMRSHIENKKNDTYIQKHATLTRVVEGAEESATDRRRAGVGDAAGTFFNNMVDIEIKEVLESVGKMISRDFRSVKDNRKLYYKEFTELGNRLRELYAKNKLMQDTSIMFGLIKEWNMQKNEIRLNNARGDLNRQVLPLLQKPRLRGPVKPSLKEIPPLSS